MVMSGRERVDIGGISKATSMPFIIHDARVGSTQNEI